MLTMLRCSWSAAAFKALLKEGDTLRLRVSDLVSSNLKISHADVCAFALS